MLTESQLHIKRMMKKAKRISRKVRGPRGPAKPMQAIIEHANVAVAAEPKVIPTPKPTKAMGFFKGFARRIFG